jgi:hypothetical protein
LEMPARGKSCRGEANEKLTKIAESEVNADAAG